MPYFSYMQPISYWKLAAPNILSRAIIPDTLTSQAELYQAYVIEEGDRPETIAYHYYGDPTYDWLVRIANNIYDEASQWPLTQVQLDRYVANKYGSITSAQSTCDHWNLNLNLTLTASAYNALPNDAKVYWVQNGAGYSIIQNEIIVTPESHDNLPDGTALYFIPVTQYDNEFEINEEKRQILLIDATYASAFDDALKNIMSN